MSSYDYPYDDRYGSRDRPSGDGQMGLPVNVTTIIFILFILITSSMELYLGSPNGFSLPKVVFAVVFIGLIEYIVRSNKGPAGQTSGLAWALVFVYFITYFTITIVATSCAKFNMKQLRDLKNYGMISPFVLSKKQLKKLREKDPVNDDDDEDDDDEYGDLIY